MPIFEFTCTDCPGVQEIFVDMQDVKAGKIPKKCDCGGKLTKLVSYCTFKLEGTGWPGADNKPFRGQHIVDKRNKEAREKAND